MLGGVGEGKVFGVFARSDFQPAPSSAVRSQQVTLRRQREHEARKQKKSRTGQLL